MSWLGRLKNGNTGLTHHVLFYACTPYAVHFLIMVRGLLILYE